MRIIHFADSWYPQLDGTVTFLDGLARGLRSAGHAVTVVVPGTDLRSGWSGGGDLVALGSVPARFAPPGYRLTIAGRSRVQRLLNGRRFDVVHLHSPFAAAHLGLAFARRRGLPVAFTYHTLFPEYAALYGPAWGRQLWSRTVVSRCRQVGNRSDLVISHSEGMLDVVRGYGITAGTAAIPLGINLAVFAAARRGGATRERFGVAPGSALLLYVGRLGREKAVDLLIPTLQRVRSQRPAELLLCGRGPEAESLRAAAADAGLADRVHFAGMVSDPVELAGIYADSDAFLFPSQTDTFGAVVAEAQASGLPVVAVNAVSSRSNIEHGVSGILAEPDPTALAGQLLRVLGDAALADRLRSGGRRSAAGLGRDAIANRHAELYQRLALTGRHPARR